LILGAQISSIFGQSWRVHCLPSVDEAMPMRYPRQDAMIVKA
jgi:hypothetical protein